MIRTYIMNIIYPVNFTQTLFCPVKKTCGRLILKGFTRTKTFDYQKMGDER